MAVNVTCNFCSKQFFKTQSEIKKSKTGLHFCTKSCAASHNIIKFFQKGKDKEYVMLAGIPSYLQDKYIAKTV